MRTVSGTLDSAQLSLHRSPIARLTVRDVRLTFASYLTISNPWSYTDTQLISSQRYCFGDSMVTSGGTILRVWGDGSNNLRVNRVTDPTSQTQWQTWSIISANCVPYCNPGLHQTGSTIFVFYVTTGNALVYRYSVDDGATWSSENSTLLTITDIVNPTIAPVSEDEVYLCGASTPNVDHARVYRAFNSGGWTLAEMPWRIYGDSTYPMADPCFSTTTFFDAFILGGKTFVVYCFGGRGKTWITQVSTAGLWSNPRLIIPDDYSSFVPYRVNVIQNKAWMTGLLVRQNQNAYSPQADVYLTSIDGDDWTVMSRDSYLTSSEIRGKMLLTGSYVYYPGLATVFRAPATYAIDPSGDPSGKKMVIGAGLTFGGKSTDDLLGFGLNSTSGNAPQLNVSLRNGDDGYFEATKAALAHKGSEIWAEAGYLTTAGNEYVELGRFNIDSLERGIADGQRTADVAARDTLFKQLKNWSSMFYWPLLSQAKHWDDCDVMDGLYMVNGGNWAAEEANSRITFSTQETEGVLFSTTPFDTIDFDIIATFDDNATTISPRTYFGLLGLASDKDNYIAFRAKMGTNQIDLVKKRGSVYTTLASTTAAFSFSASTKFRLRMVHRAGHFQCYVVQDSSTFVPWGPPLIDYTWAQDDLPCLSDNGRGKVGIYALIQPYRFHAFALDAESTAVCLRASSDGDWGSFPGSGTMLWEGEQITWTAKTGSGTLPSMTGTEFSYAAACLFTSPGGSRERILHDTYGFDSMVFLAMSATADQYNNFAVIFPQGGYPYGAWLIQDTVVDPLDGAKSDLRTDILTGHGGQPYTYIWGGADTPTCLIAPCLYGGARGANGTTAKQHTDNSLVYQFANDQLRVYDFWYSDFETDYNTEILLKRICGMGGVLSTQFDSEVSNAGPISKTGGAGAFASPTWLTRVLGGNFSSKNFDISFTTEVPGNNERAVICFRANTTGDIDASGPWLAQLENSSGSYFLYFTKGTGASWSESRRVYWLISGSTVNWRVVAQDDFVTVYLNGMTVAVFHYTDWGALTNFYIGVSAYNGTIAFTDIRIPELYEWRDAFQIDNDAAASAAIGDAIGDRYIQFLSRSGTALKFSTFDNRSNLGTFTDTIQQDDDNDQDTEIFTAIRVYCDQIIEMIDDTLARTHGFILRTLRMPKADVAQSAAMVTRLFRSMQETIAGRSQRLAANLAFEPEDKFTANYLVSGIGDYREKMQQLFGSSLIGYYVGGEASDVAALDYSPYGFHGAYTSVALGQPGIGDFLTCPRYDGSTSYTQPPAGFRSAFNNQEGTAFVWIRNNVAWSNATIRGFIRLGADSSNIVAIQKQGANLIGYFYIAGGVTKSVTRATTETEWLMLGITWSKSADQLIAYFNGSQVGATQTGLGVWVGSLVANLTILGALTGTPTGVWDGWEAHGGVLDRAATPAEMEQTVVVSGTGLVVNVPLIVDQVSYDFAPADFKMSVGARKWVS